MKTKALLGAAAVIALLCNQAPAAPNCAPGGGRPPITLPTINYYASTTGHDDGNSCTASANPCTPSGAIELAAKLNLAAAAPVVNLAAGTYSSTNYVSGSQSSGVANGNAYYIQIVGAGSGTTSLSTVGSALIADNNTNVQVSGLTITSSAGPLLFATKGANIGIGEDVILGSAAMGQLHAELGGRVEISCGFTVSGSAPALFQTAVGGEIMMDETSNVIKFTGSPAYSIGLADIDQVGMLYVPFNWIGFTGAQTAQYIGNVASGLLTVNTVNSGTLAVNNVVSTPGVSISSIPQGSTISSLGTGMGGLGTYHLSAGVGSLSGSFTGSIAVAAGVATLTSGAVTGTPLGIGQYINGAGIALDTYYIASGSGSTWVLNASPGTIGSEAMTVDYTLYTYSPIGATVTGPRYNVTTNSVIETNNGPDTYFPGSTSGVVASGGRYHPGSQPTVAETDGKLGATGTLAIGSGSTDRSPVIILSPAGAGVAAAGQATVTWAGAFTARRCAWQLASGTGAWNARATATITGNVGQTMAVTWDNNAVNLTGGSTYYIQGVCDVP